MIELLLALSLQTSDPVAAYAAEVREVARVSFTAGLCSGFGYRIDTAVLDQLSEETERRGRAAGVSSSTREALGRAALSDAESSSPIPSDLPEGDLDALLDTFRETRGRVVIECDRLAASHPSAIVADPSLMSPQLAFLSLQADEPLSGEIFYYVQAAATCPGNRTRIDDTLTVERLAAPLLRTAPQIDLLIRQELERSAREGRLAAGTVSEAGCLRVMAAAAETLNAAWAASPLTRGTASPVED